jgi:hypothetical protein
MMSLEEIQSSIQVISENLHIGRCERCGSKNPIARRAMTNYDTSHLDLRFDDDPNGDEYLCEFCHLEYVEYWNEQWREYYSGRG